MIFVFSLVALLGGIAVGLQGATNAALKTESSLAASLVLNAAIVFFLVLLLALLEPNFWANTQKLWQASPKLWMGGIYGVVILLCAIFAVPKLGAANTLMCFIWGQLVTALLIDHFGLFNLPKNPVSLSKLLGVGMVIAGAFLARK